jgi:membrane protein DedA with SNARE-associated domain
MLEYFITRFTYLGIALVLIGSGCGVPLPEDIPLLLGGAMCSRHTAEVMGLSRHAHTHLWIMIPLCLVSVVGGDMIIYCLGRRFGHHVPRVPLLRRFLTEPRLARAESVFHRHGGKTLAVARFLPGVRTPVFFTAGTFRIPWWKMLLFDGGAAMVSVPVWILVGFFFGEHMKEIAHEAKIVLTIGVVVLIAGLLLVHRAKKRL